MTFSLSTFIIEINRIPCVVFKTKWQSEADGIGRRWVEEQLQMLQDSHKPRLPPIIKIRIARPGEAAAYDAASETANYEGTAFVVVSDVWTAFSHW